VLLDNSTWRLRARGEFEHIVRGGSEELVTNQKQTAINQGSAAASVLPTYIPALITDDADVLAKGSTDTPFRPVALSCKPDEILAQRLRWLSIS
jgi:urocanate hydratase